MKKTIFILAASTLSIGSSYATDVQSQRITQQTEMKQSIKNCIKITGKQEGAAYGQCIKEASERISKM